MAVVSMTVTESPGRAPEIGAGMQNVQKPTIVTVRSGKIMPKNIVSIPLCEQFLANVRSTRIPGYTLAVDALRTSQIACRGIPHRDYRTRSVGFDVGKGEKGKGTHREGRGAGRGWTRQKGDKITGPVARTPSE